MSFDVQKVRADFPILEREINPADHDRLIRDSIQALADGKRN